MVFVSALIVVEEYEEVSMEVLDDGARILRNEIRRNPTATTRRSVRACMSALHHRVFQVTC